MLKGEKPEYMQKLLFDVSKEPLGDPDETVIEKPESK
jgi:hypothetical protein